MNDDDAQTVHGTCMACGVSGVMTLECLGSGVCHVGAFRPLSVIVQQLTCTACGRSRRGYLEGRYFVPFDDEDNRIFDRSGRSTKGER